MDGGLPGYYGQNDISASGSDEKTVMSTKTLKEFLFWLRRILLYVCLNATSLFGKLPNKLPEMCEIYLQLLLAGM
uniref:Uncharacterized protein n=1 Tax=Glossina palpalis gambiensis TaxID=67801 RepID=A0A1B0BEB8_9MUSC